MRYISRKARKDINKAATTSTSATEGGQGMGATVIEDDDDGRDVHLPHSGPMALPTRGFTTDVLPMTTQPAVHELHPTITVGNVDARAGGCEGCTLCQPRPGALRIQCTRGGSHKILANPFTASNHAQRRASHMPDHVRRALCDAHATYIAALPERGVADVLEEYQRKGHDIVAAHGYTHEKQQTRLTAILALVELFRSGRSLHLLCHCHPKECHCMELGREVQRRATTQQV